MSSLYIDLIRLLLLPVVSYTRVLSTHLSSSSRLIFFFGVVRTNGRGRLRFLEISCLLCCSFWEEEDSFSLFLGFFFFLRTLCVSLRKQKRNQEGCSTLFFFTRFFFIFLLCVYSCIGLSTLSFFFL